MSQSYVTETYFRHQQNMKEMAQSHCFSLSEIIARSHNLLDRYDTITLFKTSTNKFCC